MSDFHIPDADAYYDTTELEQSMHDLQEKVTKAAAARQERKLVKAFADGYDGLDVYINVGGGTEYRPWNDEPPTYPSWDAPAERYEFEGVTFADLREAHLREES